MERIISRFWWSSSAEQKGTHWLAWIKLCAPKSDGGMGFRHLHEFNLAMLAMQGWRILQRPDSLITRTLKARYFPNSDFLQATVKPGASLTWRSVIAGKRVLEYGTRWRIGDGEKVLIWGDRWIPRPTTFKPITCTTRGLEMLNVSQLIDRDGARRWNMNKIRSCLNDIDAASIANIPLCSKEASDVLVWHYNKSGQYTVRSGYWNWWQAKREDARGSGSSTSNGGGLDAYWKRLWRSQTPPKCKTLMWRLLRGCAATRANLRARHIIHTNSECGICEGGDESAEHLFRDCVAAQAIWSHFNFRNHMKLAPKVRFPEWVWWLMDHLTDEEISFFFLTIWAIWNERNEVIWNGKVFNSTFVLQWVPIYKTQYDEINMRCCSKPQRLNTKWVCPPSGRLKLNTDGAFNIDSGKGGIGAIIRNDAGVGIAGIAKAFEFAHSALNMEIVACREGLLLGINQGWDNIDLECDSIQLVAGLKQETSDLSETGAILEECRTLIRSFSSIRIHHVYREANSVADRIAHVAMAGLLDGVWLENTPIVIQDVLYEDCTSSSDYRISVSSPFIHCTETNLINNTLRGSTEQS